MPFEYTGLGSLRNPEIFQKILTSSVDDTGLAYDFSLRGDLNQIDKAHDAYQYYAFNLLNRDRKSDVQAMLGLCAAAIYSVSLYKLFKSEDVFFVDEKVVGIHAAAVRKNPNELIALTFGLALIEIQAEWARSATGLVRMPSQVHIGDITPADIRHSIAIIAKNRNNILGSGNADFREAFLTLSRIIRKLQLRRFQKKRTPL